MCPLRLYPSILRGIGDERFLPCHSDELAPGLGQEISPVGLQPLAVPPGALMLASVSRDVGRVGNSLDHELRLFHGLAR
jgi:hypothetical protein